LQQRFLIACWLIQSWGDIVLQPGFSGSMRIMAGGSDNNPQGAHHKWFLLDLESTRKSWALTQKHC
jgi:hypothetical protein